MIFIVSNGSLRMFNSIFRSHTVSNEYTVLHSSDSLSGNLDFLSSSDDVSSDEYHEPTEYKPSCGVCDIRGQIVGVSDFCFNCGTFLCHTCRHSHMSHSLLKECAVGNVTCMYLEYTRCTSHQDQRNDIYCWTHRELICDMCRPACHHLCCTELVTAICRDCPTSTEEHLQLCRDLLTFIADENRRRDLMKINLTRRESLAARCSNSCSVNAIACQGNGNVLVLDRPNAKLMIFAPDGNVLSVKWLIRSVWDICVIDMITAALTYRWSKTMKFVDISDPSNIRLQRSVCFSDYIFGVQTCNDSLIVSASKSHGALYHFFYPRGMPDIVRMVSLDGDILWSVDTYQQGLKLFQMVSSINTDATYEGHTSIIFLTDCRKETIIALGADSGEIIKIKEMHGKGPRGITVDNRGYVYVCCSKTKEIVVLTRDLLASRMVISNCPTAPEAIEYNQIRNELIVSCELRSSIDRFALSVLHGS